jgi:NAD(P)-dependent dehydrogenase (short-subunit alcohol dehydrogenase family)
MSKVMLITGGSRGIGAATAKLAAARGYDVAITYVENATAAEGVVAAVRAHDRKGLAVQADTGNLADITRLFQTVDTVFGRLDAFFNNAGIFGPAVPFLDLETERIARIITINTTGAIVAAREAARRMAKSRGGHGGCIVHMSSIAAKLGGAVGTVDYGSSKGAIDSLTIGMAKELAGDGVRVNAVRPGLIDTEIHATAGDPTRVARLGATTPMQRGGTAEEVAEAVLWLCSESSSYTTGQLLDVAGGRGL